MAYHLQGFSSCDQINKKTMQNLEDMTLDELRALVADAEALLQRKRAGKARSLRLEMERMARAAGLSPEEFALLAD